MDKITFQKHALLAGALSLFGVTPSMQTYLPVSPPRILSDEEALKADMQAIGDDLRVAIKEYERGLKKQPSAE